MRAEGPLRRVYRALIPAPVRLRLSLSGRLCRHWTRCRHLAIQAADPNVRTLSARLGALRGAYRGKRCVIMGSGPSLNHMDLECLRGEYVWGVNKCYLLFDRLSWRPAFYVAVDRRVVPDISSQLMELVHGLGDTRFFFPVHFRFDGMLASGSNVYWYVERLGSPGDGSCVGFTDDAARWVSPVRTVTVAALQLAVHLGFNPIYLIGCDTSYAVGSSVRRDVDDPDRLTSTVDDDFNHFDPSYFGAGSQWHEPHVERMIEHYTLSKRACDALGVEVLDATVGGKLTVFPKVDYETVFRDNGIQGAVEGSARS